MDGTALGILGAFLALHVLSTWLIMRWAAKQVKREVAEGLTQLVGMFPPSVRTMLGIDLESKERVNA